MEWDGFIQAGCASAALQDLETSDQARYPMLQQATPLEIFVEKGDMFYLPSAWWHCVSRPFLGLYIFLGGAQRLNFMLEFVNSSDVSEYLRSKLTSFP